VLELLPELPLEPLHALLAVAEAVEADLALAHRRHRSRACWETSPSSQRETRDAVAGCGVLPLG